MRDHRLAGRRGTEVIAGIRPEDLHGPGHDGGVPLRATVDRVESVGASLLVPFVVDARPAKTAGVAAAVGGEVLDEVPIVAQGGTPFVASFEPRSGVRAGDTVYVAVDTRRLRFFDPQSEASTRAA